MSQLTRYRLVLLICIVLSLGGICLSIFLTKQALDGSRGGVLAVGFALICVFVREDIAAKVYAELQKHAERRVRISGNSDSPSELEKVQQKLADLDKSLEEKSGEEKTMNNYLVVATALGTLVAAFGDRLCDYLICQCALHHLWCR
jgi:hypothetical protein